MYMYKSGSRELYNCNTKMYLYTTDECQVMAKPNLILGL